jgi:very-short-patch-repair endonuclease
VTLCCPVCGASFERLRSATRAKFCSVRCYRRHVGETSLEAKVRTQLERADLPFAQECRVGKWSVDFLVMDRWVVEADGDYWHARPGVPERDKRRDRAMRAMGYTVIRLAEREVGRDPTCVLARLHRCGLFPDEISLAEPASTALSA